MLIERIGALALVLQLAVASQPSVAEALRQQGPAPARDCTLADAGATATAIPSQAKTVFPPVQLDMSVPFSPTPFPSGGYNYLVYELHLQNYTDKALAVQALEIVDASREPNNVIARFTGSQLSDRLLQAGAIKTDDDHPLGGGKRAVAFLCLAFIEGRAVPEKLSHRVFTDGAIAEGAFIGPQHTALKVLAPPVAGADWVAANGPSLDSHHRMGLFVAGGAAHLSRRFAIDWRQVKLGTTHTGDAGDVRAYHAYGAKVFAVADAVVLSAVDGFPDNVPRTAKGFETALQLTMDNVGGNAVVLDLGDGQFAYYAHLKPGSVRVKAGDRVKRGAWLAQIGCSGDARMPHLHFQVTAGPEILASEGLPFVIDRYQVKDAQGAWETRAREYPIGDVVVQFGAGPVVQDK